MKFIVHDHPDALVTQIYKNIRSKIQEGGKLYVMESVIPDNS